MKNRAEGQESFVERMLNGHIEIYEDVYSDILPCKLGRIKCVRTDNYNSKDKAVQDALGYCNPNDIIILYTPPKRKRKSNSYCVFHVYIVNGVKCTKHIEDLDDIAELISCVSGEMENLADKYKQVRHILKNTSSALKDEVHSNLIKNYIETGKDLPQEGYNG